MNVTLDENQFRIFNLISGILSKQIEESVQFLLNSKLLYQNVKVTFPDSDNIFSLVTPDLERLLGPAIKTVRPFFNSLYGLAFEVGWSIQNPSDRSHLFMFAGSDNIIPSISIAPKTIRNYCHTCENIEPYNFLHGVDILYDINSKIQNVQVFSLSFECQGCKGVPEVFLVHRDKQKLVLCGRSPIEQVITVPQIPKGSNKFISDAIVAYNSGQVLAGIFLLRTFIEQYVRSKSKTPESEDIDSLFQEYAILLPRDFKDRFPSLKSIYDNLSIAIHRADSSEDVFVSAKEDIEYHFEGKHAFRITN
jgi:hypothetical protein